MIMNFLEYTSISKIKPSCQTLSAEPFKFLFCFFLFVCAQYLVSDGYVTYWFPDPSQTNCTGSEGM